MPQPSLSQFLRRLWALEKFGYSLRVLIAMAGSMGLSWYLGQPTLIIPLFLGIIASALAETDDSWLGRLNALLVTLLCFSIAAVAVELLFPYPWLFVAGLALSTFALVMLGALGERYGAIAQATLILAIYSMIAADQRDGALQHLWRDPMLLVAGAAWYGLLSVGWNALFAHQPVQQSLARLYRELGLYFRYKAALFEPVRQLDVEQRRLELAQQNGRVVSALNAAKETLLNRLGNGRGGGKINHYLKLYFLAQDLHERVSSSHYPYQALAEAFFHSDVLFRCQRLLRLQASACADLGEAIQMRQVFRYSEANGQALEDLQASLEHLREQNNPAWRGLLRSLRALSGNLSTLQRQLASASDPGTLEGEQDSSLLDRQPQSLREAVNRIRLQLTPTSLLFRHALRMTIALICGYAVLHAIHPEQGYWVLLTTVFVCQPNYGATRIKLVQRISGTLLGLIAGWALFDLFPSQPIQALFAVVAGVVFFATRSTQPDRRRRGVPHPAGLAGSSPQSGGRQHPQLQQRLPAPDHASVRQRQTRRPRLSPGPAQRPQRRCGAVHHAVEHAAGARTLPQGCRNRLPLSDPLAHLAQLPLRPWRPSREPAGRRQRCPAGARRAATGDQPRRPGQRAGAEQARRHLQRR